MSDVLDILEIERPQTPEISKEAILGDRKKKKKPDEGAFKRPKGFSRELNALNSDKKVGTMYEQSLSYQCFFFPKDDAVFYHWQRVDQEGEEYPFAKANKSVPILEYTDEEYLLHLQSDAWTRQESDHLYELCKRFDLRFIVIQDRWNREDFGEKTVEDLKERYYSISNTLAKVRGAKPEIDYDGDHERRRKEQLIKLYNRTQEQIEEEQYLLNELKEIELHKKQREKKLQDLQKLITAADGNQGKQPKRQPKKGDPKKKLVPGKNIKSENAGVDAAGIKFTDFKGSGVTLRSQRMKLPASVGQKKTKVIEQMLEELDLDPSPIPTQKVCEHFNELRSDMVLLNELKLALSNCNFEIETLRQTTKRQTIEE